MKSFSLFFRFVLLAVMLVLVVTACQPATRSQAVELPPELVGMVGILMMIAVTAGLKWIGDKIGVDLSGRAAEIASAFSAIFVLAINYLLGLAPAAYDSLLAGFFAFLIVFLGGAGFYSLFLRKKNASTPAPVAAPPIETRKRK